MQHPSFSKLTKTKARRRRLWLMLIVIALSAGGYTVIVMMYPIALLALPLSTLLVWYSLSKIEQ